MQCRFFKQRRIRLKYQADAILNLLSRERLHHSLQFKERIVTFNAGTRRHSPLFLPNGASDQHRSETRLPFGPTHSHCGFLGGKFNLGGRTRQRDFDQSYRISIIRSIGNPTSSDEPAPGRLDGESRLFAEPGLNSRRALNGDSACSDAYHKDCNRRRNGL